MGHAPRTIRNQLAKGQVIMKSSSPSRWKTRTAVRLLVAVATIGAGGTLVGLHRCSQLRGVHRGAQYFNSDAPVLERLQRRDRDTGDERRRNSEFRV